MTASFAPAVRPGGRQQKPAWVYEHRLLSRVHVDGECWIWTGAIGTHGYGADVTAWGKRWLAHRLAYALMVGGIPDGYQIDHLCRRRLCINPDHLEAVTQAENLRRQGAAVAACPRGHEYTEANTYRAPGSQQRRCRACSRRRQVKAVV